MPINKEQWLAVQEPDHLDVEVPGFPDKVRIKKLTFDERLAWKDQAYNAREDDAKQRDLMLRSLQEVIIDEHGDQLFTEDELTLIAEKSGQALETLWNSHLLFNCGRVTDVETKAKN